MAHTFDPNARPLNVGTLVSYSYTGEDFPAGCGYINRIENVTFDEYGVFTYTLKSDSPKSAPFQARSYQVKKIDCTGCKWAEECKNRKF